MYCFIKIENVFNNILYFKQLIMIINKFYSYFYNFIKYVMLLLFSQFTDLIKCKQLSLINNEICWIYFSQCRNVISAQCILFTVINKRWWIVFNTIKHSNVVKKPKKYIFNQSISGNHTTEWNVYKQIERNNQTKYANKK